MQLPDDADVEFYGLDRREALMNEVLARIEITDPETGEQSSWSRATLGYWT
jgi:hypothetical protein